MNYRREPVQEHAVNGMDYIRKTYGVPAKRGGRVTFCGCPGTITGARYGRLRVRFDGEKDAVPLHPTYNIVYL